ncbi:hypothetical protein PO909_006484 [Leuciscus waleckii]
MDADVVSPAGDGEKCPGPPQPLYAAVEPEAEKRSAVALDAPSSDSVGAHPTPMESASAIAARVRAVFDLLLGTLGLVICQDPNEPPPSAEQITHRLEQMGLRPMNVQTHHLNHL